MAYIVKGDKYYIPITVKSNSGSVILPSMVTKIQFLVSSLDKTFTNGIYAGEYTANKQYYTNNVVFTADGYYKALSNVVGTATQPKDDSTHWTNTNVADEVLFDEEEEVYLFPVYQNETFAQSGGMKAQVRVVTTDNEIYGSISKVVDVYGAYTSKIL